MKAKPAVCWVLGLSLALGVAASAQAEPVKLASPLEKLETVEGSAVVRRAGSALVMTLAGEEGQDRWFRVETTRGAALPAGFRSDSAQVLHWMGHLVLISGDKAWHFSVPKADEYLPAMAEVPGPVELDALLRGYEVAQVEASGIYSAAGPRAERLGGGMKGLFANQDDQQDPGGGGVGGCGSSCSIQCGGGSSCTVTCGAPRCAFCSCPASCFCR